MLLRDFLKVSFFGRLCVQIDPMKDPIDVGSDDWSKALDMSIVAFLPCIVDGFASLRVLLKEV